MPFDANGCVSTLVNVNWIKWMWFCVNEFEIGVDDSTFSDSEQQKVYWKKKIMWNLVTLFLKAV